MEAQPLPLVKCYRTACDMFGVHRHSQNHKLYCHRCTIKINEANPLQNSQLIPFTEKPIALATQQAWSKLSREEKDNLPHQPRD